MRETPECVKNSCRTGQPTAATSSAGERTTATIVSRSWSKTEVGLREEIMAEREGEEEGDGEGVGEGKGDGRGLREGEED